MGSISLGSNEIGFIHGVKTITVSGDVNMHLVCLQAFIFSIINDKSVFTNADAEMLFIPYLGTLILFTGNGKNKIKRRNSSFTRGITTKISTSDRISKGYICENYGSKFNLPDKGVVGANCLANARDASSVAAFEEQIHSPITFKMVWFFLETEYHIAH